MSADLFDVPPPPADLRLAYGAHPDQFGDLRRPEGNGPHPLVITIHGGYWRQRFGLTYCGYLCAALRSVGIATWNIEYRRIAGGEGGWPATFLDVAAAADQVRRLAADQALDLGRVAALGHSAGGHLALWLAGRPQIAADSPLHTPEPLPLRAAIALAGVVDLRAAWELRLSGGVVRELLGGTPQDVPERYAAASPAELQPITMPQVLIHGTADDSVPYGLSERYAATVPAATLITLPGVDHFAPVDPRTDAWTTVLQAVRAGLGLLSPT